MIVRLEGLRAVGFAAVLVVFGWLLLAATGCSGRAPHGAGDEELGGDPGEPRIREERPVSSRAFETRAEEREIPDADDAELQQPTDHEERDGDADEPR